MSDQRFGATLPANCTACGSSVLFLNSQNMSTTRALPIALSEVETILTYDCADCGETLAQQTLTEALPAIQQALTQPKEILA